MEDLFFLLDRALAARQQSLAARRQGLAVGRPVALRLFNGFLEGYPELVVDLFARTLVIHSYADPAGGGGPGCAGLQQELLESLQQRLLERLPWIGCIILKSRLAAEPAARRGIILTGGPPDRSIQEGAVWYALDLLLNQDNSFYLDTRALRDWARLNLAGKTVLNTFAYTGSLGVAALAGGAARVVQIDHKRAFLEVAKESYRLNGFPVRREDFRSADFFPAVSGMKRSGELFDCVFLDPPFFSATARGSVDLVNESSRLINKVRPLIRHGGILVAINNALFVSGAQYLGTLERLGADGYLHLEALIPVPPDCAGYPDTVLRSLPADPAPFNHSTKIAVLRVRRKDGEPRGSEIYGGEPRRDPSGEAP